MRSSDGPFNCKFIPLQDRLYDFDDIAQPYVDVDVCPFDYIVQGGSGTGSGGGLYTPDDDILIERTPVGSYGTDVNTTPVNGSSEEQDETNGPAPLEGKSDALPEIRSHAQPNEIYIENAGNKTVQYELYSISGQLLGRYQTKDSFSLPITAPGIYLLKMQSEGRSVTRKIYVP
jgi:hypothetical protein